LLKEFEKISNDSVIKVNWFVENNDPEIIELGNILDNRTGFRFNFIST
jgi:hypothetical protein